MLYLVKLKMNFNEMIKKEILKFEGRIDYISKIIPSLIFVEGIDKTTLEKLNYIESVENDEQGYLKGVEVRPPIDFKKLLPYSNYKDIKVAVIDSGICKSIVKANIIKEIDLSDTSLEKNSYLHGTGVTDIINQVVPNVQILNAKITDNDKVNISNVIKALEWAYINKANVINLSLGFSTKRCKGDCILCKFVDELTNRGTLVITAAGNEGPAFGTINCPGNSKLALTVGAVNLNKQVAQGSSRGRYGQYKPDLVTSGYIYIKEKKDLEFGTSFATPIITGVAAAIFNTYKKPQLIKSVIMNSTDNIGYPYHEQGRGLFNIHKLVEVLKVG